MSNLNLLIQIVKVIVSIEDIIKEINKSKKWSLWVFRVIYMCKPLGGNIMKRNEVIELVSRLLVAVIKEVADTLENKEGAKKWKK